MACMASAENEIWEKNNQILLRQALHLKLVQLIHHLFRPPQINLII